jgi:CheY-like chemotaxis protein
MEATGGRLELKDRRIVVDQSLARLSPDLKIDHSYVVLSVSDTGHGIDPLVLPRIFEPFFTTKSHGKGTGLGLSVVHGIVRSHDGAITVQSEPRRGTTFEIYLPEYEGEVAEVQKTEMHVDEGRGERILLVDDQVEMLETMKDILLDLGYHVLAFNDPKQALDAFNAAPDAFDLILTDLTMPHLTGIDLTRKILAIREHIPVILTTGYQQLEDTEPIRNAGIREIIPKPFRVDTIAKTLRAILSENGK